MPEFAKALGDISAPSIPSDQTFVQLESSSKLE